MKIGIIGTGNVGKALGEAWATHGHENFFWISRSSKSYEISREFKGEWERGNI